MASATRARSATRDYTPAGGTRKPITEVRILSLVKLDRAKKPETTETQRTAAWAALPPRRRIIRTTERAKTLSESALTRLMEALERGQRPEQSAQSFGSASLLRRTRNLRSVAITMAPFHSSTNSVAKRPAILVD